MRNREAPSGLREEACGLQEERGDFTGEGKGQACLPGHSLHRDPTVHTPPPPHWLVQAMTSCLTLCSLPSPSSHLHSQCFAGPKPIHIFLILSGLCPHCQSPLLPLTTCSHSVELFPSAPRLGTMDPLSPARDTQKHREGRPADLSPCLKCPACCLTME